MERGEKKSRTGYFLEKREEGVNVGALTICRDFGGRNISLLQEKRPLADYPHSRERREKGDINTTSFVVHT